MIFLWICGLLCTAFAEGKTVDVKFVVSKEEYLDAQDPHILTLSALPDAIRRTMDYVETSYPNSTYGIIEVHPKPYLPACFSFTGRASYGNITIPDLTVSFPVQPKNPCNLYSPILSSIMQVIESETPVVTASNHSAQLIIGITNYYDVWHDKGVFSKCDSLIPLTVGSVITSRGYNLAMFVTEDTECSWLQLFDEMEIDEKYVQVINRTSLDRDILAVITDIVEKGPPNTRVPQLVAEDVIVPLITSTTTQASASSFIAAPVHPLALAPTLVLIAHVLVSRPSSQP